MTVTIAEKLAASKEHSRLLTELKKETHPSIRTVLKQKIQYFSDLIGLPTAELDEIGISREPFAPDPIVDDFWATVRKIGIAKLNHSTKSEYIAINMKEFFRLATSAGLETQNQSMVKQALYDCRSPRLVEANRTVRSAITGGTLRCWVFKRDQDT